MASKTPFGCDTTHNKPRPSPAATPPDTIEKMSEPDPDPAPDPGKGHRIPIPIRWVGVDDLPAIAVNQFAIQLHEDEIFLTTGTLIPPLVVADTEDEFKRSAQDIPYATIRPAGRYLLSRRRAQELLDTLQKAIDRHDENQGGQP